MGANKLASPGERRAPSMWGRRRGPLPACFHRAVAESTHRQHPVIQDDGAGHADIDGKACGNLHDELAGLQHLRREREPLGPEDIGGASGVAEARQLHRIVGDLHPHQAAADGQAEIRGLVEMIERQHAFGAAGIAGLIVSRRAKRNEPGAPSWMHTLGLVLSIIGLVLSVIFGILQLASLIAYFAALSSFSTY